MINNITYGILNSANVGMFVKNNAQKNHFSSKLEEKITKIEAVERISQTHSHNERENALIAYNRLKAKKISI